MNIPPPAYTTRGQSAPPPPVAGCIQVTAAPVLYNTGTSSQVSYYNYAQTNRL